LPDWDGELMEFRDIFFLILGSVIVTSLLFDIYAGWINPEKRREHYRNNRIAPGDYSDQQVRSTAKVYAVLKVLTLGLILVVQLSPRG
jgi:hypothetical protein